jgi:hypothetical protein
MFSKSNKEPPKTNQPNVEDLIIPNTNVGDMKIQDELQEEQPPLVKLVEKISSILSPYFIVIVGLYLYDNNFLFGTLLIAVGIFSLLKVSYQDVWQWIEQIKGFFGKNELKP